MTFTFNHGTWVIGVCNKISNNFCKKVLLDLVIIDKCVMNIYGLILTLVLITQQLCLNIILILDINF